MGPFCYFCFMLAMLSCLFTAALGSLLGNEKAIGSFVCDVFLCFCPFPMWYAGSGVVLDCIDS